MAHKSDWMSHVQSRCKIADMGALLTSFEFRTNTVLSKVMLISLITLQNNCLYCRKSFANVVFTMLDGY